MNHHIVHIIEKRIFFQVRLIDLIYRNYSYYTIGIPFFL